MNLNISILIASDNTKINFIHRGHSDYMFFFLIKILKPFCGSRPQMQAKKKTEIEFNVFCHK